MIIQGLLELLFKIFSALTSIINIPDLPEEIDYFLSVSFSYIETGFGILKNFMPLQYMGILFGIVIAVDVGVSVYHFVMWVLKKIPVAGIQ